MIEDQSEVDQLRTLLKQLTSGMPAFEEVINRPEVIAAYDTLRKVGLLYPAKVAQVFCAYCGADIIRSDSETSRMSTRVSDAVTKHREGCALFLQTLKVKESLVDAEKAWDKMHADAKQTEARAKELERGDGWSPNYHVD